VSATAVFSQEHDDFRQMIREFIDSRVLPRYDDWYAEGIVPREFYYELANLGIFGIEVPIEYGGEGIGSFKFQAVIAQELARAAVLFGGSSVHVALCLPYLKNLATEAQKRRWFPTFITGETMFAIAMTEPAAGSDLAGMRTTARLSADGGHYVLNGAKTFITGGIHADRVIVCARTAAPQENDRRFGLSLFVVDTKSPGYAVGRKLDKLGLRVSDTAELSFSDVAVPVDDLLGEEHRGFTYLGQNLPRERLSVAVTAAAQAAAAVRFAMQYTDERTVFGKRVASFQNTKFELASCHVEADAARLVAERGLEAHDLGTLTPADAAAAKLFCTETASRVIDRCLQLHGGYGYINEYPISRLYADSRVNRIYGGTSEVMKMIVAKDMGL
jgi:acyl-CoA dehydrogenase